MSVPTRLMLGLLLLHLLAASAIAGPFRREVSVTMFAVPDAIWQKTFEAVIADHAQLWTRLDEEAKAERIARIVETKVLLVGDKAMEVRSGEELEFVESWTPNSSVTGVMPRKSTKRFIGTVIRLQQEERDDVNSESRIALKFEHHIAPPVMQRINYATAAERVEREKLSVGYPRFETFEWKGQLSIWSQWRLVAQILRPQREGVDAAPAVRFVLFMRRE